MIKVARENSSHISIGGLKKNVRKRVPMNGEKVPITPNIDVVKPKYSPLLSFGAILEIVTEKNGLVMLSPTVNMTTLNANITRFAVNPKMMKDRE